MIADLPFATPDALAQALAGTIADAVMRDVAARGEASLILSGGRTPRRLFMLLADLELPWDRVSVTLADERLVPLDHADSNSRMLRESLFVKRAAAARFLPIWQGSGSAAQSARATFAALPKPVSLVLLGMGEDGHTASLFPDADGLAAALDPRGTPGVLELAATAQRQPRISLDMAALTTAHHIAVAFEGAAKRAVYERARGGEELPIRAVLRQTRAPVSIFWSRTL